MIYPLSHYSIEMAQLYNIIVRHNILDSNGICSNLSTGPLLNMRSRCPIIVNPFLCYSCLLPSNIYPPTHLSSTPYGDSALLPLQFISMHHNQVQYVHWISILHKIIVSPNIPVYMYYIHLHQIHNYMLPSDSYEDVEIYYVIFY